MQNFLFLFQVKNKAAAPVQITAEQLLREAKERQLEIVPPVSTMNSRYEVSHLAHLFCYHGNLCNNHRTNLTWKSHIHSVSKHASQKLGFLASVVTQLSTLINLYLCRHYHLA